MSSQGQIRQGREDTCSSVYLVLRLAVGEYYLILPRGDLAEDVPQSKVYAGRLDLRLAERGYLEPAVFNHFPDFRV